MEDSQWGSPSSQSMSPNGGIPIANELIPLEKSQGMGRRRVHADQRPCGSRPCGLESMRIRVQAAESRRARIKADQGPSETVFQEEKIPSKKKKGSPLLRRTHFGVCRELRDHFSPSGNPPFVVKVLIKELALLCISFYQLCPVKEGRPFSSVK